MRKAQFHIAKIGMFPHILSIIWSLVVLGTLSCEWKVAATVEQKLFNAKPGIRTATLNDTDAITDIVVKAWWPAPEQAYVF